MNQRDRLIELIEQGVNETPCKDNENIDCTGINCKSCAIGRIADHLLANGVIVPPCKVGDTVYRLARNEDGNEWTIADFWEVVKFEVYDDELWVIDDSDNYFTEKDIGKTVFLAREEAEKSLAKLPSDVSAKIMIHFTEVE